MKKSKQTFVPVGDYLPGAISLDASIPLGLRKVRLELWREWHRYNRIKLAAALAGDISTKRDARVTSIYARRGDKDGYKVKIATAEIKAINERLSEFHSVVLNHAKVDEALALLSACKPAPKPKVKKAKPQSFKARLAEARKFARKGFSTSLDVHGTWVMITPDNYKQPIPKIVAERVAAKQAHEEKFAKLGKCQCEIHKTEGIIGQGEFSKARKQA